MRETSNITKNMSLFKGGLKRQMVDCWLSIHRKPCRDREGAGQQDRGRDRAVQRQAARLGQEDEDEHRHQAPDLLHPHVGRGLQRRGRETRQARDEEPDRARGKAFFLSRLHN